MLLLRYRFRCKRPSIRYNIIITSFRFGHIHSARSALPMAPATFLAYVELAFLAMLIHAIFFSRDFMLEVSRDTRFLASL